MKTEESIIDRVQKLLALADKNRNGNENEATRAAMKAQELMLQYGIELAQIAARKDRPVGIGKEIHHGRIDPWRRDLAQAVAVSMGGRTIWQNEPRKWTGTIAFWGQRETVAGMVALYQYLEGQLTVISAIEASQVKHANAAQSMRWRRGFLAGMVHRISARLQERRRAKETNHEAGVALVVIKSSVDRAVEEAYNNLTRDKSRRVHAAALAAGKEAGDRVDLLDPKLHEDSNRPLLGV